MTRGAAIGMPQDRLFRRSLIVSGAIHFLVLSAFTFLPLWPRRTIVASRAPLVVTLMTLPAPVPAPPVVAPEPVRQPPVEKLKPEKRRVEQTQVEKAVQRESPAQTRVTEKPREPEPQPQQAAPVDSVPPVPAAGPLQIASIDEPQFTYDYYLQSVIGRISEAWMPPAGLSGPATAMVRFRIMAQGQVYQIEVENPSGSGLFDRTAREAVMRAQPFPPFPPAYRGRWITLHLRFVYGR